MRATSTRRRATRGGRKFTSPADAAKAHAAKDLTVPVGTPDSIICMECGANVPMLANGKPKGHANGGTRPNIKRGEYKCEGSGRY